MNIAYLVLDPGIPVFGTKGASVHVQEVVRGLRALGHTVTVHALRTGEHPPADLADLDVTRHRLPKGLEPAEREQAVRRISTEIADSIAAGAHGEVPDLVIERYALFSDAAVRIAEQGRAVGRTIRTILEVNAPLIDEQRRHRFLGDVEAAETATRRQLTGADVVACVSPAVANWAVDNGGGTAVHVLPNGVNTDRITPRPELTEVEPTAAAQAAGPVRIGFVGTLKPWHGTDALLRAAADIDGVHLEICGDGPERENLESLAAELGLTDRTTFHGALAPADVPAHLHRMDIAVAPYPAGEHYFSPLKVYEYLAAGLPTVASAIGTIPALLEDGRLGVLVEPGSVEALQEALAALAAEPERRTELARAAREAAVRRHDWRARCAELLGWLPEETSAKGAEGAAA